MRRSWLLVSLMTAGVLACSSNSDDVLNSDPEAAVVIADRGQTFDLRVGQTAMVMDGGLVVGFRGVESDSRCPVDVTCVWGGDAELEILVTIGRMAWTEYDLHTGVEPQSAQYHDWKVTVVDLKPQPREGKKIPRGEYVVKLKVE